MVYILLLLVGLILVVFCIWVVFSIFASWWPVVMGGSHSGIGLWLRRLW